MPMKIILQIRESVSGTRYHLIIVSSPRLSAFKLAYGSQNMIYLLICQNLQCSECREILQHSSRPCSWI